MNNDLARIKVIFSYSSTSCVTLGTDLCDSYGPLGGDLVPKGTTLVAPADDGLIYFLLVIVFISIALFVAVIM